jgi:hypothetical protein
MKVPVKIIVPEERYGFQFLHAAARKANVLDFEGF